MVLSGEEMEQEELTADPTATESEVDGAGMARAEPHAISEKNGAAEKVRLFVMFIVSIFGVLK